jgi:hypothetical protein
MMPKLSQEEPGVTVEAPTTQANGRKPRKASIPFTQSEAATYAEMLTRLTNKAVGIQQDDSGQWGVCIETTTVKVKRLTTINAITTYLGKTRQQVAPTEDEDMPY